MTAGYSGRMPRTLLVVQDDLFFSSMVEGHARRLGIPVQPVSRSAVASRAGESEAVVVMQLTLNPERQLNLLAEIRAQHPHATVVAVTGHLETTLRRRARALGARLASNSGLGRALERAVSESV